MERDWNKISKIVTILDNTGICLKQFPIHNKLPMTFGKLLIPLIFGIMFVVGFIPESFAANANLFVSAENSRFDNFISGPQVIEVVVIDSDISQTDKAKGEPDVTVNGKILRMVQSVDGNWYGYFADENMALIADGTTTEAGIGLDYGAVCTTLNEISSAQDFANIEFDTNVSVALGATSCTGVGANPTLQNVLREAKALNNNGIVAPGQIDINPGAWPLIQLYLLNPTGNVVVQYNKGGGVQTTTLTFDIVDKFVELQLDKPNYNNGDSVNVKIIDSWLNVDPTDEDSWTFGTGGTSTNYQVFDKNGNTVGDTTSNTDSDLTNVLDSLMCADNCRLLINTDVNGQGTALTLQDNANSEIRPTNPQQDGNSQNPFSWETFFGNISGDFPVTLTEQTKNSGEFTTFDEFNVSNLVITDNAVTGNAAQIDYNETPFTILVINDNNSPPDCSGSFPSVDTISPANKKLVDVSINGVIDSDSDDVAITITGITQDEPTSGLKGKDVSPDGIIVDNGTAQVRAQKDSQGNGRVYEISFMADDGNGGTCEDSVNVYVPKNKKSDPVDDGQIFDSTDD